MVREVNMQQITTKKDKVILMGLLVVLNLIIRIPSIPHEKGFDSFFIHSLANSVSNYGAANWWLHWSSIFGSYPYSYASAVPFLLSGTSQLTGLVDLEMEHAILLFSIILGLFSIFSSYILAGLFNNNFLYKYFTSMFFSLSQGILVFTTWEPSSRGPFMVFLSFILFMLLSNRILFRTKMMIFFMGFIFLASVHHYYFFMLGFIGIYIFLNMVYRYYPHIISQITGNKLNLFFFVLFLSMLILPFFTRFMINAGSRYGWVIDALEVSIRYMGPVIIFSFSGVIYLIFKKNKKQNEWYLLLVALMLFPFIYNITYGIYIILLFAIIFAAQAMYNSTFTLKKSTASRVMIIAFILSFVFFSSFYNHFHTGQYSHKWFMKDSTYDASEWTYNYIPENSHGFGQGTEVPRLFATSNGHPIVPRGGALDVANSFINQSSFDLIEVSPTSKYFYFEGFYIDNNNINIPGTLNWILEHTISYKGVVPILDKYDLSYFIMPATGYGEGVYSIRSTKNSVFDNGAISIWLI